MRGVIAWRAGDSSPGMRAGAAKIKAGDRGAILGPSGDWTHEKKLLERQVAETQSVWAEEILNDLRTFLPKFWVVKPKAAAIDSLLENLRRAA